jgi:hypothetical protein
VPGWSRNGGAAWWGGPTPNPGPGDGLAGKAEGFWTRAKVRRGTPRTNPAHPIGGEDTGGAHGLRHKTTREVRTARPASHPELVEGSMARPETGRGDEDALAVRPGKAF